MYQNTVFCCCQTRQHKWHT